VRGQAAHATAAHLLLAALLLHLLDLGGQLLDLFLPERGLLLDAGSELLRVGRRVSQQRVSASSFRVARKDACCMISGRAPRWWRP
jgi:hypothetical protein